MNEPTSFAEEPAKRTPVLFDTDVAVVGSGVSGAFAALAAAASGADTVLIERHSCPGGNMGPGMIAGGSLTGWPADSVKMGSAGIPAKFLERYAAAGGGGIPPYSSGRYMKDSNTASLTLLKMMEESGIRTLFSNFASDPIATSEQGGVRKIGGVYVENKSGRQAVRAKVTIDATGEADLARRAGLPIIDPEQDYHEFDTHAPNGPGLYFAYGGVNWEEYDRFTRMSRKDDIDWKWVKKTLGERQAALWQKDEDTPGARNVSLWPLLPKIQLAWETGEFRFNGEKQVGPSEKVQFASRRIVKTDREYGIMDGRVEVEKTERADWADSARLSKIEVAARVYVGDLAAFLRRHAPGFENCHVLCIAPYFGARGGPCVRGDYTLTTADCREARRFDDVVYLYGEFRALNYNLKEHGEYRWTDFPYRVLLPQGADGLLAAGRSASSIPDTLLRSRMAVMHMGQVAGTAAALAAETDLEPRQIDVKELQRRLLDEGFYLGDSRRLRELELL